MKKYLCIIIIAVIGIIQIPVYATNGVNKQNLKAEYNNLNKYIESKDLPVEMSWETYLQEYSKYDGTENEYIDSYYSILNSENKKLQNVKGSSTVNWWYNTGTELPQEADYSKYNLIDNIQVGDIVYEDNGGFGITGHIAIVEGVFYSEKYNQKYIRIIEAISKGVCRGVLDDARIDSKDVTILRVSSTDPNLGVSAVEFCKGQLGKAYMIDFQHDLDSDQEDWYCSELVWAAYKNAGIDIETTDALKEPGVTPRNVCEGAITTGNTNYLPIVEMIKIGKNNEVIVRWKKIKNSGEYRVYRSFSGERGTFQVIMPSTESTEYRDEIVPGSTKIWYRIAGKYTNLKGIGYIISSTATLPDPQIKSVKIIDGKNYQINWSSVEDAEGYKIFANDPEISEKFFRSIVRISGNAEQLTITANILDPKKPYSLKIFAYGKSGNSKFSKPVSASPEKNTVFLKPGKPKIELKKDGKSSIKISWSKATNTIKYELYQNNKKIITTTGLSYIKKSLKQGKKYSYKVRGVRTVNGKTIYGSFSTVKSLTL